MTPVEQGVSLARAATGTALVCRPGMIDRLQGARMLAQSGIEAWFRSPVGGGTPQEPTIVYGLAAGVDTLHAASMLALATACRRMRRPAMASAGIAAAFAAADLLVCCIPAGSHPAWAAPCAAATSTPTASDDVAHE